KGINSYNLHTAQGSVHIATPSFEKTIATVYRGGGPKGIIGSDKESFDRFLLGRAIEEGAHHEPVKIDRIEYVNSRPILYSDGKEIGKADLVVGAFGTNSSGFEMFEKMGFGYRRPDLIKAAITEINVDAGFMEEHFGNSIHLFLLPMKNIKFAALIPKGTYLTLCILGKDMSPNTVSDFLDHEVVRKVLPKDTGYELKCRCFPKMNVKAPKRPYTDRLVLCGDAGSTRLFKDGLGAAYVMGKAAATTAVFHGVGHKDFKENYYPVYKSIIVDNRFGKYLYSITDLYRNYSILTKGMLAIVRAEQKNAKDAKRLSSILWDMFTGNERYKKIFGTAVSLPMHLDLWKEFGKIIVRRQL
ncbi:MAG: hypothetical protein JSV21_03215, partial [Nitrospirota bacterium]